MSVHTEYIGVGEIRRDIICTKEEEVIVGWYTVSGSLAPSDFVTCFTLPCKFTLADGQNYSCHSAQ